MRDDEIWTSDIGARMTDADIIRIANECDSAMALAKTIRALTIAECAAVCDDAILKMAAPAFPASAKERQLRTYEASLLAAAIRALDGE